LDDTHCIAQAVFDRTLWRRSIYVVVVIMKTTYRLYEITSYT